MNGVSNIEFITFDHNIDENFFSKDYINHDFNLNLYTQGFMEKLELDIDSGGDSMLSEPSYSQYSYYSEQPNFSPKNDSSFCSFQPLDQTCFSENLNLINVRDSSFLMEGNLNMSQDNITTKKHNKKINGDKLIYSHKINDIYKCTYENCYKGYKSKENLTLHIKNIHLKQKPYQCNFCTSVFSHRNGKTYHERKFHTQILPHKCVFEGK
jgi:hypothetical protein